MSQTTRSNTAMSCFRCCHFKGQVMPIANEELDALDRLAKESDKESPGNWYGPSDDIVLYQDDDEADIPFIVRMSPATAQRLTATIREQSAEIERLQRALVYVAYAGHATALHMLPTGVMLIDGHAVEVKLDGKIIRADVAKEPTHDQQ